MLRTAVPPETLANQVRAEMRAFDPTVPMYAARSLADIVDDASSDVRQSSNLLAALATLTVGLAGTGVFSLLAYAVSARRRDLAIRVALGATPRALATSVLRHAAAMMVPGVALGLGAAVAVNGTIGTLLHNVEPLDPTALLWATLTVAFVALAASYIPARRAGRVDPVGALKE